MIYTQVEFQLNPDSTDNREILIAIVSELNFESFSETEDFLYGYIPGENIDTEELHELTDFLPFSVEIKHELIPEQNWNEVWEKNYFKPLLIGGKCLIRAPFHTDYEPAELELVIEPKMAFGTGNHETTTLVSEQILEMSFVGKDVLDMGCGTGILGMLASLKGAEKVTAIDIDKWSFESTNENAKINSINNLIAKEGDASILGDEVYDVIFANIHKNVIINDLPKYFQVLKPGGEIFLSGFYLNDIPDVQKKAEDLGLSKITISEKNNWVVCKFAKS